MEELLNRKVKSMPKNCNFVCLDSYVSVMEFLVDKNCHLINPAEIYQANSKRTRTIKKDLDNADDFLEFLDE